MRTSWTKEQKDLFRQWHNDKMDEMNYPNEIKLELSRAMNKFINQIKTV